MDKPTYERSHEVLVAYSEGYLTGVEDGQEASRRAALDAVCLYPEGSDLRQGWEVCYKVIMGLLGADLTCEVTLRD